jgi:hypothetical protein
LKIKATIKASSNKGRYEPEGIAEKNISISHITKNSVNNNQTILI